MRGVGRSISNGIGTQVAVAAIVTGHLPGPIDTAANVICRIRAEFDEMPGMHLTFDQTARLMGIDKATCTAALSALTERGFLCRCDEMYFRADAGEHRRPA